MFGLDTGLTVLLIVALISACAFEFINGFHDTANAVATVIYTKSLKPQVAVIWSGIWNFIGVYFGGIAVAMGIVNLLPLEVLVDQNIYHNIAMILALILTAILWNTGTWYFGIPCSSSHTLIGSIFGVGIAYMFISADGSVGLNWKKVTDAGLSLMISPLIGFFMAMLMMYVFRRTIRRRRFFKEPRPDKKTPFWIRLWLIITCTSVSYSHGSNDGQKGVGLIMIILIALLPAKFALDSSKNTINMMGNIKNIDIYVNKMDTVSLGKKEIALYHDLKKNVTRLNDIVSASFGPEEIPEKNRFDVRKNILSLAKNSEKLLNCKNCKLNINEKEMNHYKKNISELKGYTEYSPWWVILMISLSLGIGTMIGWKRIVVTIGEKIGKTHLSYAQGASAEMVAASTIGISTLLGLPVSTTHVLSSGVAGSMVAQGGLGNLQFKTVKNILIAWVVTIPVTIILSGSLFLLLRWML
ncbi:MAG: inorganic phosphate transporter [Bacteroidia bacterium]|nr:inorganic phosphate transporter [Bacteroidia bacterium]